MLPPDMICLGMDKAEDTPVEQNPFQQHLWLEFEDRLRELDKDPPTHILTNGDMIDGEQYKTKGDCVCLHRIGDQVEGAYKILSMIKNRYPAAGWLHVVGTPYHEVRRDVETMMRNLHFGQQTRIARNLLFEIGGVDLSAQPRDSRGPRAQGKHAGARDRPLAHGRSVHGYELPRCAIFAHMHCFVTLARHDMLAVINPCMQMATEFMQRKSAVAMIPDLSFTAIDVEDRRACGKVSWLKCTAPTPECPCWRPSWPLKETRQSGRRGRSRGSRKAAGARPRGAQEDAEVRPEAARSEEARRAA